MKILFFDDFRLGVLHGDTVVDASQMVRDLPHPGPHDLINALIANFSAYRERLQIERQIRQGVKRNFPRR